MISFRKQTLIKKIKKSNCKF